jgi:nucleotide-binding universal stress UspA family protein
MKIKRILVPTDFSRQSLKALDHAISAAREHDAEIVLVHAIEPLPSGAGHWTDPAELVEFHRTNASREMARLEAYAKAQHPKCRSEIRFGDVDEVIADLVRELSADVVVIAVMSPAPILVRWLGGIAEKLMRRLPCPILTVPANAHQETRQATA